MNDQKILYPGDKGYQVIASLLLYCPATTKGIENAWDDLVKKVMTEGNQETTRGGYRLIFSLLLGGQALTEEIKDAWNKLVEESIKGSSQVTTLSVLRTAFTQQIPPSLPAFGVGDWVEEFADAFAAANTKEIEALADAKYVCVIPVGCGMDNPNPDPMDAPLV